MKILITGMTGFIGASLTKALFHSDHEIIGLVKNKSDLPDQITEKYKIIKGDLSKEIPEIDCDLVIHCGAIVSDKIHSYIMNKVNVEGTRRLLEATPKHSKFIHISCASVYNLSANPHREDETIIPKLLSPYGNSKYLAEQIVLNEFPERDAVILRPRAIYGKGDKFILPRMINIYKDGIIKVPGDLNQKASMTHIDFFVDVILAFISKEFSGKEIINVADYHIYNLRDNMLNLFSSIFDRKIEIEEKNEHIFRVLAGIRTVLIPGNQFTQNAIDYLTRDHLLAVDKLQSYFPHLKSKHFDQILPDYVSWINSVGLSKIAARNKRIVWL